MVVSMIVQYEVNRVGEYGQQKRDQAETYQETSSNLLTT
jgi:hypothetical protein